MDQAASGTFIVIVGPSTGGKTTLVNALLERIQLSVKITTCTTRKRRPNEREGADFFFLSKDEFEEQIAAGDFIEWSEHFGDYYGMPRKGLEKLLSRFSVVFAILDINGAKTVLKKLPEAITIFIKPEHLSDLERRQRERIGITEEKIRLRLERAQEEIALAPAFHHTIVNKDGTFDDTLQEALGIVEQYI